MARRPGIQPAIRALGRAGPRVATSHPLAAAVGFTLQRCCCFCERVRCCADDNRFFRVLDGMYDIWIAQFGISGDPAVGSAVVLTTVTGFVGFLSFLGLAAMVFL